MKILIINYYLQLSDIYNANIQQFFNTARKRCEQNQPNLGKILDSDNFAHISSVSIAILCAVFFLQSANYAL